jgi:undecaprenyl-diphosphatase
MAVISALVLLALAAGVKAGAFAGADQAAAAWMDVWRGPAADAAANAITFFGSTPWTLGAAAVMCGGWWRAGRAADARRFAAGWVAGLAVQFVLRFWVAQWRPDTGLVPADPDWVWRYELAGFTSGHAFRSAYLFGWWGAAAATRRVWWAASACALAVIVVGLTRVYLDRHWMTDIIGGWLLAASALSAARAMPATGK